MEPTVHYRAGIQGRDLKVGDAIRVWWPPGHDTITRLEPYYGPLGHFWPTGARVAHFAQPGRTSIVGNSDIFGICEGDQDD